jgi:hypothetical protein
MYPDALTPVEIKELNAFHSVIYDLLINSLNYNFAEHHAWARDHYSNHSSNILAGLLATARLTDNQPIASSPSALLNTSSIAIVRLIAIPTCCYDLKILGAAVENDGRTGALEGL